MTMLAYLNDPTLKARFLAELALHREEDRIIRGTYGEVADGGWKGCAVGCSLRSLNRLAGKDGGAMEENTGVHARYPAELGIPLQLAYLEDRIFEGLPMDDSKEWPERFSRAIHVGADLSLVWPRFIVWLLGNTKQHANKRGKKVIDAVIALYERRIAGDEPTSDEWNDARFNVAANAAADAAAASYAAARQQHYKRQSDALVRLLEECVP